MCFLTNEEYQVLMMNGGSLELWHTTPYNGHEGFEGELKEQYEANPDEWDEDDIQYLKDCGIIESAEDAE